VVQVQLRLHHIFMNEQYLLPSFFQQAGASVQLWRPAPAETIQFS
jgi:hypothetical protein